MMRVRVCHLTSVHPAYDNRIFHKECKCLSENGFEVHLIAPKESDEKKDGIWIHALPTHNSGRINRMTGYVQELYRTAREVNADIYHFHDPELIPVGLALKAKGKKVIYDTHEDVTSSIKTKPWIPRYLRYFIATSFYYFEQMTVKCFDAIISGHPAATKNIRCATPLYNYPDLRHFPLTHGDAKKKKFLWLGMLSEGRGATKIREAVRKNKSLEVDVIGPLYDIHWSEERMNFLGKFSVETAFEMARGYLAGLVTYLPEENNINSSPNKLFEYMALGIPVIASNFSDWKEIIEQNKCGLCVDPSNPDDIAAAMQYFLDDLEAASIMGRNGRRVAESVYNWGQESKRLLEVYRALNFP